MVVKSSRVDLFIQLGRGDDIRSNSRPVTSRTVANKPLVKRVRADEVDYREMSVGSGRAMALMDVHRRNGGKREMGGDVGWDGMETDGRVGGEMDE